MYWVQGCYTGMQKQECEKMKREELKFEDWGAIWLNYKKEFVKESTYANYLTAMANHIIPAFQGVKIEEISNRVGHSKNNTDVV